MRQPPPRPTVKDLFDGFSVNRHQKKEQHFQIGYGPVILNDKRVPKPNSRLKYRPLGKSVTDEKVAIPILFEQLVDDWEPLDKDINYNTGDVRHRTEPYK